MKPKSCRSPSITTNDNSTIVSYDFDNPINQVNKDYDKDTKLPEELARLLKQEEKVIQPHEKSVKMVNLGTSEKAKQVKLGSTLQDEVKSKLIKLLKEYMDVFAWSYQDMPELNTNIVVHHLPLKEECPPVKKKLRKTLS